MVPLSSNDYKNYKSDPYANSKIYLFAVLSLINNLLLLLENNLETLIEYD
jgi:hypothetical protein